MEKDFVKINLLHSDGSEEIKMEKEIFLELALEAAKENKTIEEKFKEMLTEYIQEEGMDDFDIEDVVQELEEKVDDACPNCGSELKDNFSGVNCKECRYWFCY